MVKDTLELSSAVGIGAARAIDPRITRSTVGALFAAGVTGDVALPIPILVNEGARRTDDVVDADHVATAVGVRLAGVRLGIRDAVALGEAAAVRGVAIIFAAVDGALSADLIDLAALT